MTGIERLRSVARIHRNSGKMFSAKLLEQIADQIEREQGGRVSRMRVLAVVTDMERHVLGHEGMEWPVFEDGEPVRIGSNFGYGVKLDSWEVTSILFTSEGCFLEPDYSWEGDDYALKVKQGERVKRPAPKVLDADGVEIRVGDRVWSTKLDEPHEWIVIDPHGDRDDSQTVLVSIGNGTGHARPENLTHRAPVLAADGEPLEVGQTVWDTNGDELVVGALEDGGHTVTCRYADVGDAIPVHGMWSPSDLTHTKPEIDTWERIEEDADALADAEINGEGSCNAANAYCNRRGLEEGTSFVLMAQDLVRRAKKLAGVDNG